MTTYALSALGLIAVAMVLMRLKTQPVRFCRTVFAGLVSGSPLIERQIDWEHLTALGVDVGATYTRLPDQARPGYRQAFIEHFSSAFHEAGGSLQAFTHWRIDERTPERLVVAADYPVKKRTLAFSISAAGPRQLEALQWK